MSFGTETARQNKITYIDDLELRLLVYRTYEDYLDSFLEVEDVHFMLGMHDARKLACLGYKRKGTALCKEEFDRRRENARVKFIGKRSSVTFHHVMATIPDKYDSLTVALAERETCNKRGIVQSIIFVRVRAKFGFEVSGYIDYAYRLETEDWTPFFKCKKKLYPRKTDLGYYNWRNGTVFSNLTRNYKPCIDYIHGGLQFQNRNDLKMINPNPKLLYSHGPGENTSKQTIKSGNYAQIEIYDHIVRRRQ